ncbi:hypothetical protein ILUMI_25299 [Ignelater luminosus]|uniref:Battenin n=1 Tax=Ignelater luminosus TaxID=2038154 RepID=A0A8K0FY07_IGNLU|nr:hypothetical protein ILUMI_25299 [Ignelater luminosus]
MESYRMTTISEKPKINSTESSPINTQKISLKQRLCEKINSQQFRQKPWRALIAYWILGICNNYGYVVMLSAANDILHQQEENDGGTQHSEFYNQTDVGNPDRQCNYISTGAILLADILPSLIIKMFSPFLPFFIHVRLALCVVLGSSGYLLVAFSTDQWMSILGVVVTSLCSGLGEVSLLQYSSFYDKDVVSTWSSGTGAAGVAGALSYAALHSLGLRNALLIMLVVPLMMAISFWVILPSPPRFETVPEIKSGSSSIHGPRLTFKKKLSLIPGLLKYMIPLGLVYLFEYFINQGMFELINFEDIFLNKEEQYRWLQVDYQIGVFISRSSVNILHIKRIWLMSVFQLINVVFFTTEVIFYFTPTFWIILAITLWEGLLGGAAYVNTFYKISTEVTEEYRQFSLGTTGLADSIGITLAGVFAILAHNGICNLPKPERLSL